MRVIFWGTRGSVPTPGPATVRYGGNTSCVEVRSDRGTLIILDCGTGIRELGLQLARRANRVDAHLFLGHTHWDHISGFPFFGPVFMPGHTLNIYGAHDLHNSLEEVLAGQMNYAYFPVPMGELRADLQFHEIDVEGLEVEDVSVHVMYLNHTAVCIGYRLEADGQSLAYITDHEAFGMSILPNGSSQLPVGQGLRPGFVHAGDRALIEFVRGVDLLIQDAQYTPDEYVQKHGWGHGSADYVTDVAIQANVRSLALFHHEPTHSDADVDAMVEYSRSRARDQGAETDIFGAAERHEIDLGQASAVVAGRIIS